MPGGSSSATRTGREYAFDGEFREVEPCRRLVYTQRYEDHEALNVVAFRDLGGRTEVTVVVRFASMADREGAARSGMAQGMAESLDRLAEALGNGAEIVMSRVFAAPRELAFRMWTEPEHVARWWGPQGFTTTIHEMDVRPERLVYDHLENPWFRHQVTFTPVGAGTEVTVHMRFRSAEERDEAVRRYGALEGLGQTLGRLADALSAAG